MKKQASRHPKIQYWSFNEEDILSSRYREIIDRILENGCFDTLCISSWTMDLWDLSNKPLVEKMVRYADARGIRMPMQVFPKGMIKVPASIGPEDAAALVTEHECVADSARTTIRADAVNARDPHVCRCIKSELLRAYAFRKTAEGVYEEAGLADVTDRAEVVCQAPGSLTVSLDTKGLEGFTVYAMVAHYYACIDLFSDLIIREYKELMDAYSDVPLGGIVLDEFKNKSVLPPWQIKGLFRERFYGENFRRCFLEQTGRDLITVLFEMRFCPRGRDEIRIRAINLYFEFFRRSTKRVETFVAEYSRKVFGANSFQGLHNTYHNDLQHDEIWATGCNWWEVPRRYAQTDEDIAYPVRMGIACGCPENLAYDMYYAPERRKYLEKAVRDARFGCRIHYHIIRSQGDSDISLDTGNPEFLAAVKPYEDKIELLNLYDPAMPKMELLVVFGFPALCNWYPDESARNVYDINGKLNIEGRVKDLWERGYLNALAPGEALCDGRITRKGRRFDYCGHTFDKLLYLYPEYSKKEVLAFLGSAIRDGCDVRIIGGLTRDFDGNPVSLDGASEVTLKEDCDIPEEMKLTANPIPDGCVLEDGSVVIANGDSIRDTEFCTYDFPAGGFPCRATFRGVMAVRIGEDGGIERLAAGNLKEFRIGGKCVLKADGAGDCLILEK